MMREGDLIFDFTDAEDAFKFDQMNPSLPNYHGIGEMNRVDFVVEFESVSVFVEVKDPSSPKSRPEAVEQFLAKLEDGTLSDTFASKFMDTFIYRWAEEKANKPIHFISLVTLDIAQLTVLSDEIAKKLPPIGIPAKSRWTRALVASCQLFNLETWNENFPQWPVVRESSVALGQGSLSFNDGG